MLKINLKNERIDTTRLATYVCAAADKTCLAPFVSVSDNTQDDVRQASARFEALNSTGSVTSETITDTPKNTQPPITKILPMLVYASADKIMPIIISGNSIFDIKLETLMRPLLNFKNL